MWFLIYKLQATIIHIASTSLAIFTITPNKRSLSLCPNTVMWTRTGQDSHWCHWGSFRWRAAWTGRSAEFCSSPAAPYPPSDPAAALLLPGKRKTHTHTRTHTHHLLSKLAPKNVCFESLQLHKCRTGAPRLPPLIICSCLRSREVV